MWPWGKGQNPGLWDTGLQSLSRTESAGSEEKVSLPQNAERWNVSPPRPSPGRGSASAASDSAHASNVRRARLPPLSAHPGRMAPGSWVVAPCVPPLSLGQSCPFPLPGLPEKIPKFDPSSLHNTRNLVTHKWVSERKAGPFWVFRAGSSSDQAWGLGKGSHFRGPRVRLITLKPPGFVR